MIGQTLGHYRVIEKVAAGGMGVVYRAHDEQLERDVALKVLPTGAFSDDSSRRQFRKEALALAKLNHPNIETIYEFDSQDGTDFLVMEYVDGKTLEEALASGPLPEKEVLALGMQIAAAMEEAHHRGIVHRDLKPRNIAITARGQAKVLDFGLAKLLAHPASAETVTNTQAGAGTLPYMPPEQLELESVDARADIYTMGAVLYEMATDVKAFPQQTPSQLIEAILRRHPAPPRALNSRVSPELERIILKCLDKDPGRRYQSAQELLVDLRRLNDPSSTSAVPAQPPRRFTLFHKVSLYAACTVLALGCVSVLANVRGLRDRLLGRPGVSQIRSLAVLPFDNLSGDPDQQYFADGMTDALITDLGQIQALRVISRTSVLRYKGTGKSLEDIGRELNVDAIIEGSAARSGDVAQVTARLVYARSEATVWSKSYQRELQNVLVLQADVANAIVQEIDVTLTPQEQARLSTARQVDPAAHEAYLKANALRWGTAEQKQKAQELFEQAITIDPSYAPPYAGLAHFYQVSSTLSPSVAMPQAKQYAQKAVELDPSLPDAHLALGLVRFFGDWDWPNADREFRRALELNPSDSEAHRTYSYFLVATGNKNEAIAQARRAQELDPLNITTQAAGWVFYFSRQYDEAIAECRKALELDPNSAGAYDCIGSSSLAKGNYNDAIAASEKAFALSQGAASRMAGLGEAYAYAGKTSEARKVLKQLEERSTKTYVPPILLMEVHLALGEREPALALLDEAFAQHDTYLVSLKSDPAFDPLRSEPRFQTVLQRIGFPADAKPSTKD
jgi:eukaryotic-like serine/threonine-protein kinase